MKLIKEKNMRMYYEEEKYKELGEMIIDSKLDIVKVLKDDHRSKVLLVNYKGELLVVKEPKEKNSRKWQKFLSVFRGSESYREFINCKRVLEVGFKGPKSILVIETFKNNIIDKSYFVSSFIEGKEGSIGELDIISEELERIHQKGYLHGDSQLVNFMVNGEEIYLIDCKLMKNKYGKFGAKYEFIYLERSCHREIDIYSKTDIYYKAAISWNRSRHWFSGVKKNIRKMIKGE